MRVLNKLKTATKGSVATPRGIGITLFWLFLFIVALVSIGLIPTHVEVPGFSATFSEGAGLIWTRSTKESDEYIVTVLPQGWQQTSIVVGSGDSLEFQASGRVNTALFDLVQKIGVRYEIEQALQCAGDTCPRQDQARRDFQQARAADSGTAPEAFFTDADRARMLLYPLGFQKRNIPWGGPGGVPFADDPAFLNRTQKKILPGAFFGILIGSIHPGDEAPLRTTRFSDAFAIGDSLKLGYGGPGGRLWLIVNDVLDDADTLFPNKFYIDNVGQFLVSVKIIRAK